MMTLIHTHVIVIIANLLAIRILSFVLMSKKFVPTITIIHSISINLVRACQQLSVRIINNPVFYVINIHLNVKLITINMIVHTRTKINQVASKLVIIMVTMEQSYVPS